MGLDALLKRCFYRGNESLEMIEPRYQSLSILGYGTSIGTPGSIEAEVIVVRDYNELEEQASQVRKSKRVGSNHSLKIYFLGSWKDCCL